MRTLDISAQHLEKKRERYMALRIFFFRCQQQVPARGLGGGKKAVLNPKSEEPRSSPIFATVGSYGRSPKCGGKRMQPSRDCKSSRIEVIRVSRDERGI